MALSYIISIIYEWVRQSWIVASIVTKYFLIGLGIKGFYDGKKTVEELSELLTKYSKEFLVTITLIGAAKGLIGLEMPVFLELFSQVIALAYLGFLFWKF